MKLRVRGWVITAFSSLCIAGCTRNYEQYSYALEKGDITAVRSMVGRNPPLVAYQFPGDEFRGQRSALELAVANGHRDIALFLIKQGASVTAKDIWGITALHAASEWGDPAVISALLAEGADPNARDMVDTTPLWLAARNNNMIACKLLLEAGGDPSIKDDSGMCAQGAARQYGASKKLQALLASQRHKPL